MQNAKRYHFKEVSTSEEQEILRAMVQPVTATQLSRRLRTSPERCSCLLHRLRSKGLVRCLNPKANRNRLFWLTHPGVAQRCQLPGQRLEPLDFPNIDWDLYASVCYSHRGEVIRSLTHAMQPATIKRRATFRNPNRRMSANNVRDVIRYLKENGIVRAVTLPKRRHPGYELTEGGLHMRRLLLRVEARL